MFDILEGVDGAKNKSLRDNAPVALLLLREKAEQHMNDIDDSVSSSNAFVLDFAKNYTELL